MIVIPAIDLHGGKAVRLTGGHLESVTVYADDPAGVAVRFEAQGASMIHVVDLDAALEAGDNRETLRRAVAAVDVPVQVGGGLRSERAVGEVVAAGAARVVVGTEAIRDEGFLRACLARLGERLVVALDTDGRSVRVRGWTEEAGGLEEVLARLEAVGTPRYLVTAVSRDGTLEGPDVALYEGLREMTDRPVIASGGVGGLDDLRALRDTGAEAVVVGKALYEGRFTLAKAMEAAA